MLAKSIKVFHAPDGADYFQALKDAFSPRSDICMDNNLADEPVIHQSIVFVFLLTPAALAATELAVRLQTLDKVGFPILPLWKNFPIIGSIPYLTRWRPSAG